jgi:hypothetical protein
VGGAPICVKRGCRNTGQDAAFNFMKQFYFDLAGAFAARDRVGHQCASRREAKEHAKFIAHRIGAQKPVFARPGNFIRVRDEYGAEIYEAPIQLGPGYRSRQVA